MLPCSVVSKRLQSLNQKQTGPIIVHRLSLKNKLRISFISEACLSCELWQSARDPGQQAGKVCAAALCLSRDCSCEVAAFFDLEQRRRQDHRTAHRARERPHSALWKDLFPGNIKERYARKKFAP